jgi:hypothetical protein
MHVRYRRQNPDGAARGLAASSMVVVLGFS